MVGAVSVILRKKSYNNKTKIDRKCRKTKRLKLLKAATA